MPKKTFALEAGGPPRVTLEWSGMWKNLRVAVDGSELGVIANKKELEAGRHFPLPSGGMLGVKLVSQFAAVELRVTRDGVSLPGSASDPAERVKQAAYMLYILAGLNLVLGAVAEIGHVEVLRAIGVGWASMIEGAVFGVLGWRVMKHSKIALMLGIALFAIDTVLVIFGSVQGPGNPPIAGLVARILFFMPLVKGLGGLNELRAKELASTAK